MPIDTFAMPDGYADYITDDEMDAKVALKHQQITIKQE